MQPSGSISKVNIISFISSNWQQTETVWFLDKHCIIGALITSFKSFKTLIMSKSVNFVVLCPNGRRQTVKVSQNSSILQVLEEACRKQEINPDDFDICHYNKRLDLSLPVRFANIANNALLELRTANKVRKESTVTIGLQLETGERIMKDFVPSKSVWEVVEQCSNQRPDILSGEKLGEPVCIYMRQKLTGEDLKSTTLRNLGLTKGTAIIRLMYRKADEFEDQAHVSTPLLKPQTEKNNDSSEMQSTDLALCYKSCVPESFSHKQEPAAETIVHIEKSPTDLTKMATLIDKTQNEVDIAVIHSEKKIFPEKNASISDQEDKMETESVGKYSDPDILKQLPDSEVNLNVEEDMKIDESPIDEVCQNIDISDIKYIGERHCILYSLNDITETKKADLPDEFFELTITDVKYLMDEYKQARIEMENQPLLTKQQRQHQVLQKLSYYKETVIRIYFPEKLVLQAVFMTVETVQHVMDFVRTFLEDKQLDFYLYITPPKQKLLPSKTLFEAMLIPAAVVYFGCNIHYPSYLQTHLTEKISDPRAASLAAAESRKQSLASTPINVIVNEEENENVPSTSLAHSPVKLQKSGKLPKWIKLSRQ